MSSPEREVESVMSSGGPRNFTKWVQSIKKNKIVLNVAVGN